VKGFARHCVVKKVRLVACACMLAFATVTATLKHNQLQLVGTTGSVGRSAEGTAELVEHRKPSKIPQMEPQQGIFFLKLFVK